EFAGLLAEIDQDRAGFENADRLAAWTIAVEDCRDLAVRADLDEFRLELFAFADGDRLHGIGQAHFLERDADLAAVRGPPGPQFDAHRRSSPVRRQLSWRSIAGISGGRQDLTAAVAPGAG